MDYFQSRKFLKENTVKTNIISFNHFHDNIKDFNLDSSHDAGGFHPAGDVDCVTPDVVLWLLGTDDSCHHATLEPIQ